MNAAWMFWPRIKHIWLFIYSWDNQCQLHSVPTACVGSFWETPVCLENFGAIYAMTSGVQDLAWVKVSTSASDGCVFRENAIAISSCWIQYNSFEILFVYQYVLEPRSYQALSLSWNSEMRKKKDRNWVLGSKDGWINSVEVLDFMSLEFSTRMLPQQ